MGASESIASMEKAPRRFGVRYSVFLMHRVRRILRRHWFYLLIQIAGACVWVWLVGYSRSPQPGVAIAFIALIAAVMSVHPNMERWQKFIWILLIGAFLVTELRAIKRDRSDAAKQASIDREIQEAKFAGIRNAQNSNFADTVQELKHAYTQSQQQFEASMRQSNIISREAERASRTASEGVLSLTGADSYISFLPIADRDTSTPGTYRLMASVIGSHSVWDARVEMAETDDLREVVNRPDLVDSISMGSVSPTYSRKTTLTVTPSASKENIYTLWVWSRSQPTREVLKIRFDMKSQQWEMAYHIWLAIDRPKFSERLLASSDWVPLASPSRVR